MILRGRILEKECFSAQVRRREVQEKEVKKEEVVFNQERSLRSDPKLVSPKTTLFSSGPKPVTSGRVVAGPFFDVVSNLPGACGVTADVVVEDTPPGPWAAGIFPEEHDEVSCAGVVAQAGWAAVPLGCSSQLALVVGGTKGNFFETVVDPDAARVCGEPLGEVAQPKADPAVAAGSNPCRVASLLS